MPPRWFSIALLLYWLFAAWGLIFYDVLPEFRVGTPPDLRTISRAGESTEPARWAIRVLENPADLQAGRSVGEATTRSERDKDGWVKMSSEVWFDSAGLLSTLIKGPALARVGNERIEFVSHYHIDPSGNLRSFDAEVRRANATGDLWRLDGRLQNQVMQVESRGPLAALNRSLSFPYHPREVVLSQFGPLDRLPGLQVGQRWEEQMASPLTGQVETVKVEVTRKSVIHWDKSPVNTLEVVHRSKALMARTWVRADGLVLRQEVVTPLLKLVLERQAGPFPNTAFQSN